MKHNQVALIIGMVVLATIVVGFPTAHLRTKYRENQFELIEQDISKTWNCSKTLSAGEDLQMNLTVLSKQDMHIYVNVSSTDVVSVKVTTGNDVPWDIGGGLWINETRKVHDWDFHRFTDSTVNYRVIVKNPNPIPVVLAGYVKAIGVGGLGATGYPIPGMAALVDALKALMNRHNMFLLFISVMGVG